MIYEDASMTRFTMIKLIECIFKSVSNDIIKSSKISEFMPRSHRTGFLSEKNSTETI